MNRELIVLISLIITASVLAESDNSESPNTGQFETRCGWFDNPTPGNISLYDRDGEWIIGVQGGHQVEGDWEWPEFTPERWARTNVNHGYGCVCLEVQADHQTHEILAIGKSHAKELKSCQQDQALKKWKEMFQ